MAAPIGPGDWVECVDDRPCPVYGPSGLSRGAIYCVAGVEAPAATLDGVAVYLRDVRSRGPNGGFGLRRFRPIYRPSADLIESLKAPPQRVTEAA